MKPIRVMDIRGTYKGGGGPDKTVLYSALNHDKRRVKILVTYLREPKDDEFQITAKAEQLGIEYVEILDRKKIDLRCLLDLRRLIKVHKLEIYHAHDDKTLLYGWFLKLLIPKIAIIYTCHGNFPPFISYKNFIRHKISLFLKKRYLKPVMAVSDSCRRKLVEYGLKKKDIIVLHNGINIDEWRPGKGTPVLRAELGLADDDFLVGTVTRIDPQKDLITFLKVAQKFVNRSPKVRFVVIGDGKNNELEEIKKETKRLGLAEIVFFPGHRADIRNMYASLDIFLLTSIMEGMPNTVLEAMAMQIPVVSTAVSGVPEIIMDGKEGFLCEIKDDVSIADRVSLILSDSELRNRIGQNARARIVREFSFKDRVRKLEDQYEYYGRLTRTNAR